jgi:hypothetical protein
MPGVTSRLTTSLKNNIMKTFITIATCMLLLSACKKGDDPKKQDTLPTFTCGDTSDDGKFEKWNSVEGVDRLSNI